MGEKTHETRHAAKSLLAVLATVCAVGLFAYAIIYPIFARTDGHTGKPKCLVNLKQLGMAVKTYLNDYDVHYPLAADWCDALSPYVKRSDVFPCTNLLEARCGYAYNRRLTGFTEQTVNWPVEVVLCYEARGGWNLAGGPELAECRHADGFFLVYVDGHTQALPHMGGLVWNPAYDPDQATGAQGRRK